MADERELPARIARALGKNIRECLVSKIRQAKTIIICGGHTLGGKVREILTGLGKRADYLTSFQPGTTPTAEQGTSPIIFTELDALPREDTLICIAEERNAGIITALAKMGFANYLDFNFLHYPAMFDPALIYNNISTITEVWSMLADEESRETFISVLEYRLTADPLRLRVASWPQYFHPVVQPRKKDVIIDGGAFTGDTALDFVHRVGRDCLIFSFEPGQENYQAMVRMISDHGLGDVVIPVKAGLWNEPATLSFDDSLSDGSYIGGQGGSRIKVIDLDSFAQRVKVTPTLIKLDVEKAEVKVLQGAEQLIKKQLPRLQVCVYHSPADLWEIPLAIKRLSPDYRVYLGHHWLKHEENWNFCETVAYATVER